jgi:hypothetical protein
VYDAGAAFVVQPVNLLGLHAPHKGGEQDGRKMSRRRRRVAREREGGPTTG